MTSERNARPGAARPVGRALTIDQDLQQFPIDLSVDHAVTVCKRGRSCTVAKLVTAQPLGERVIAMPYRHRQAVGVVSMPIAALAHARRCGARRWVVRLDGEGRCLALPLPQVEACGWLKPSEGIPEWFVSLDAFEPIAWQDWPYVEPSIDVRVEAVRLPTTPPPSPQLALFDVEVA